MRSPRWGRAALVLWVLGATAGPLLDALHTHSGATWYGEPQLFLSVWWCPPLFAFAALSIGLGRLATERALRVPLADPGTRAVAFSMSAFVVAYGVSAYLPVSEVMKTALLLVGAVVVFGFLDRSPAAALGAVSAGLGGWVVEHTLVGQRLFFHKDTGLDGVALWIPPLYFLAAFAIGQLARKLAVEEAPR